MISRSAAQSADNRKPVLLDGYIDEDAAAAEIGCKPRTLRTMPDGPPYVVLNRKRRYPVEQFKRWLAKRVRTR